MIPKMLKMRPDECDGEVITYSVDQIVHSEDKARFRARFID